ncbi:MAG: V-type ATP synthase subunit D [Specibacter sp.]
MSTTGRAAKVQLEHRLETARHGARLLDRKQHLLADQLEQLQRREGMAREEWQGRARDAALWLGRSSALDGSARIAAAAPLETATAAFRWGNAMGVRYPEDPQCRLPELPAAGGSSALTFAAEVHQSALLAGIRDGVLQRSQQLLAAELAATRTRQRAVERRWIPRLETELQAIRRQLDAQELEESLRLRWAADRTRGETAPTAGNTVPTGALST